MKNLTLGSQMWWLILAPSRFAFYLSTFARALGLTLFLALSMLTTLPEVSWGQTCDCSKIIVICSAPAQPNDPCSGLSSGACGSCTCSYIELMNTSACAVDSIDISAGPTACTNYCGYLKDEAGAKPGDPCYDGSGGNGVWVSTPPRPSSCKSLPAVRFTPNPGQDPMQPYPACSSNFIIKVCSTTPGITYTITLYFEHGTTCTKSCTI